MKKRLSVLLLLAVITMAELKAADQLFRWGITAGGNISKVSGDGKGFMGTGWKFDSSGGYYLGLLAKVGIPLSGLGFDASFVYSQELADIASNGAFLVERMRNFSAPVHLRYDFELPLLDEALVPYVFMGPQCSFSLNEFDWYQLFSQDPLSAERTHETADWNETARRVWKFDLGVGMILGNRIQIAWNYTIPLNTAFRFKTIYNDARDNFKMGNHRIGMTYFF